MINDFIKNLSHICPDRMYLTLKFYYKMGRFPKLRHPRTFNEKLQWLKLYNRRPEYTKMVDKYAVKEYIADKIGEEYVIPTLGVWERFDDINFDELPNQFVLKCTHDSGGLVICRDKEKLDLEAAREKINHSLKRNYYWHGREWPYKNVPRKIICEKYMTDDGEELADYKIHSFNGIPKVILVCLDRFKHSGLTEDFYSDTWEHLDVKRPDHPNAAQEMKRPAELEAMLELSRVLSKDIPFVRTDFYTVNHRIYFGEMTFFPASGFGPFVPEEWDLTLGEWIDI